MEVFHYIMAKPYEEEKDPCLYEHGIYKRCPGCKVLTEKFHGCKNICCCNVKEDKTSCLTRWCQDCGESYRKEHNFCDKLKDKKN